ncbi:glycosyltransferase family 2 protein [Aliarcobacter butzleri]|uniref:glycosyltransferase family 2 protein n=1 Tax=Aliarcobacter butzleri TaxID=28197 RepID=UPI003B2127D0
MKKENPLVSVAIITYNQKEYLKECIESILEQDYDNIEIVVSDDFSTDGTQIMLKEYDKKYPNKFVLKLSDKNQGITKNSNLAHFSCTGKYIAWMGGDDLMLPGKIRKQVEYMEKNPECTICYHNLEVFQSETNETLYYFNEKAKYNGDVSTVIKYGTFNGACSNIIRASKAPKTGYNETIAVASDWLYWVETLGNGGTIDYIDEILGRYRRHKNNVTKNEKHIKQNELDHLNSCNIILSIYPEYSKEVFYRYSKNLIGLRHKLNYSDILFRSFCIYPSIKSFGGLLIYFLTLGKVKK